MGFTADELRKARDTIANFVSNAIGRRLDRGDYELLANYGWRDIQGDVREGDAASSLTYEEFRDTPWVIPCLRNNQVDTLSFRFQLQHDWDRSAVKFHLHTIPLADPASPQNVVWDYSYAWAQANSEVPANSSWTSGKIVQTVTNGAVNKEKLVSIFDATPPGNPLESDVLLVFLQRDTLDSLDNYVTAKGYGTAAANMGLISVDCHYRCNKHGTDSDIPE